jgi:uncharacterized protein YdaU (DUF1376 family)
MSEDEQKSSGKLYMPLWTDAFLADIQDLSTLEVGAYWLILLTMWRKGGSLENNEKKIRRIARLQGSKAWPEVRDTIMPLLRVADDGTLTQKRLKTELERAHENSAKNSHASKVRWERERKKREQEEGREKPRRSKEESIDLFDSEPPVEPPKRAKQERKTRLPEDWKPSEEEFQYALDKGMTHDQVRREVEKFINHWISNGESKSDWSRTWKNWAIRALEYQPRGASRVTMAI